MDKFLFAKEIPNIHISLIIKHFLFAKKIR